MVLIHEPPTRGVDQLRPLATERLGEQRHRILAGVQGGGMELDELEIGETGAGAGGDDDSLPGHTGRVGGV